MRCSSDDDDDARDDDDDDEDDAMPCPATHSDTQPSSWQQSKDAVHTYSRRADGNPHTTARRAKPLLRSTCCGSAVLSCLAAWSCLLTADGRSTRTPGTNCSSPWSFETCHCVLFTTRKFVLCGVCDSQQVTPRLLFVNCCARHLYEHTSQPEPAEKKGASSEKDPLLLRAALTLSLCGWTLLSFFFVLSLCCWHRRSAKRKQEK